MGHGSVSIHMLLYNRYVAEAGKRVTTKVTLRIVMLPLSKRLRGLRRLLCFPITRENES
jgi:hypothetical protein